MMKIVGIFKKEEPRPLPPKLEMAL